MEFKPHDRVCRKADYKDSCPFSLYLNKEIPSEMVHISRQQARGQVLPSGLLDLTWSVAIPDDNYRMITEPQIGWWLEIIKQ